MRALSNLLLVFNLQQSVDRQTTSAPSQSGSVLDKVPIISSLPFFFQRGSNNDKKSNDRNVMVQELLKEALKVGQVGSLASEEERQKIQELANRVIPLSDPNPAKYPIQGEHRLVYSASQGASSGRIFGKVVGKVTQLFENDEIFYNRVELGPLRIALQARREVKNGSMIKVSFLQTNFFLFDKLLSQKQAGGGGVWKCRFVGKITDDRGQEKLVRIMDTPSLFILEQPLN